MDHQEVIPAKLFRSFMTLKALDFPWEAVSPTEHGGIEYHLKENVSVVFEDLFTADGEFSISEFIVTAEGFEAKGPEAVTLFKSEFYPSKTQARVDRFFKEDNITCFFNSKQITFLKDEFESKKIMAKEVQVFVDGKRIEEVTTLPEEEFDDVMDIVVDFDIVSVIDYSMSEKEIQRERDAVIKKRIKQMDEKTKRPSDKNPFKTRKKKVFKRLTLAAAAAFVQVGAKIALTNAPKHWGFAVLAGVLSTIALALHGLNYVMSRELFSEIENDLRSARQNPMGQYAFQ